MKEQRQFSGNGVVEKQLDPDWKLVSHKNKWELYNLKRRTL